MYLNPKYLPEIKIVISLLSQRENEKKKVQPHIMLLT